MSGNLPASCRVHTGEFASPAVGLQPRCLPGLFFGQPVLVKVACHCGHVGLADAATLPRSLTCSACGESRYVESGVRITNRAFVLEWLLGASGAPRVTERKL